MHAPLRHRIIRILGLLCVACLPLVAAAEPSTGGFESNVDAASKPWTHLDFYNDPQNFKFAIVADRAGGVRPGVFADAVHKLNLVMPEFVMSVGDFIPGNTSDRQQLATEWADFDEELAPLKPPFFFVPGNHDINNDVMREVWNERAGAAFYWFVYKEVLFLALDSTGDKGEIIPEEQIECMREALATHADARWTFVFLHHPLWLYDQQPSGFDEIQQLLRGRRHTVFAGHIHHYLHDPREEANYYVLATTGGGSPLRGTRFGEFDHVTLVTVTDRGPLLANLRLDGILPHDVTDREDYELTQGLMHSTRLPVELLTDDEQQIRAGTLQVTLHNPSRYPLRVEAKFLHHHQLTVDPASIDQTIPSHTTEEVQVAIRAGEPVPADSRSLLQLAWTMGYELQDEEDLFLSGTRTIAIRPSEDDLIATVSPQFVDSLDVAARPAEEGETLRYTTDGTTPTVDSPLYEEPFSIDRALTFKVRRFNDRGHGTATATQSYRPIPAGQGFRYQVYDGRWIRMPDFSELTPVFSSVATDLRVEQRQLQRDHWAMVFEGNLSVEKQGQYTFYLNSDDGSKLFIDDQLVIDNDGDHSLLELSGATELTPGLHRLRIEFFEAEGEAILELDMAGPDLPRQSLPVDRITH